MMAHKPLLYIVKLGGGPIDQPEALEAFLWTFANLALQQDTTQPIYTLLVHGGGKLATELGSKLGIAQQIHEGRRITDSETLKVVTMVYAGYVNKTIVASLQAKGCNALGLTGTDANLITAQQRAALPIDYGFVGDPTSVNTILLDTLFKQAITPIIAPITHNKLGQLLNTNADTIAQTLAVALSSHYSVELVYTFEKNGVLADTNNPESVISTIDKATYQILKEKEIIHSGMLPKLDNAFAALEAGVASVRIGKADALLSLVKGQAGTTLTHA
jgi:acetylglutamate kinase